MRTTFTIDRVCYVAEFTARNEFHFYVDAANSGRAVYQQTPFERSFGDDPPDTVWLTTGAAVGHIFQVRRHVEDFIVNALRRYNPFFFTFAANQVGKISLYRRVAERLRRRHGFSVHEDGGVFRFTRTVTAIVAQDEDADIEPLMQR